MFPKVVVGKHSDRQMLFGTVAGSSSCFVLGLCKMWAKGNDLTAIPGVWCYREINNNSTMEFLVPVEIKSGESSLGNVRMVSEGLPGDPIHRPNLDLDYS